MARRLVRAKARLREAGVAYQVPPLEQLPERREAVLAVLYLIFNEGYAATAGDALVRRELCAEAIRLARVLAAARAGRHGSAWAVSRSCCSTTRAATRASARTAWRSARRAGPHALGPRADRGGPRAARGTRHLASRRVRTSCRRGSVRCTSRARTSPTPTGVASSRSTTGCSSSQPSPVVELNRAIAVGLADGADAGLRAARSTGARERARGLRAVRRSRAPTCCAARAARPKRAVAYREAIERAGTSPERAFLEKRLEALSCMKLALAIVAALWSDSSRSPGSRSKRAASRSSRRSAPDGSIRATHVWFAESDGELWLEAGSPENPWFDDLGRDPRLELRAEGHDGAYLAERSRRSGVARARPLAAPREVRLARPLGRAVRRSVALTGRAAGARALTSGPWLLLA